MVSVSFVRSVCCQHLCIVELSNCLVAESGRVSALEGIGLHYVGFDLSKSHACSWNICSTSVNHWCTLIVWVWTIATYSPFHSNKSVLFKYSINITSQTQNSQVNTSRWTTLFPVSTTYTMKPTNNHTPMYIVVFGITCYHSNISSDFKVNFQLYRPSVFYPNYLITM